MSELAQVGYEAVRKWCGGPPWDEVPEAIRELNRKFAAAIERELRNRDTKDCKRA